MTQALRWAAVALGALALGAALPPQLDSQYVLQRYALALDAVATPKAVIFSYSVSQAGPSNIDQTHTIYRSGMKVRDETLSVNGERLAHKSVRISRHSDRYAIDAIAPRTDAYQLLFLYAIRDGHHLDYVYDASPLGPAGGAVVYKLVIDGLRFLPRAVYFRTSGDDAKGSAVIEYRGFGRYWLPTLASVNATVGKKPARERIVFGDYRFPSSLPPWTFVPPKPLPHPTLPPI
jgi:hypothetical protein